MFQDPAFACYAMHKQSIEDFVIALSRAEDPNNSETQRLLARQCNLNFNLLTLQEKEYIERQVSSLWPHTI